MPELLLTVVVCALLPTAAMLAGGVAAALRPPGSRFRSYIQHFAAGVVFSVVAVELLPDVMREHAPVQVVIGFTLGVVLMLGIKEFARRAEGSAKAAGAGGRRSTGLLVGVGVDILIDGVLIGVGFAAGAKQGKLLTLALTVELLSLGLALSTALGRSGYPRGKAIARVAALAPLIVVGAGIGASLLSHLPHGTLEVALSFGLAALLFLVTEELLVEAHEEPDTPLATGTFFFGFLLFLVLGMVA